MKYINLAILIAWIILSGIYLYNLEKEINSLHEIVLELQENKNVPHLTITGKYPYIEAKKGTIIIVEKSKW